MDQKLAPVDLEVARIAARQHGVISSEQLARVGISASAASKRRRSGRLHRMHQGVYAVGHPRLTNEGRWMAAALACGAGAAVSHLSAAQLWRLLAPSQGPVHMSLGRRTGRAKRPGIQIHRPRLLLPAEVIRNQGIPVTTPARTIADLRGIVTAAQLRRAIRQAEVLRLRTGLEPVARTRSELEDRFLALCRRHRLPVPEVNVRVGGYEVDFLWRAQQVVVETDGYRYHRGSQAFEDDRDRDLDLRALGYDVRRFTYRQVTEQPRRVATAVRTTLG